jgi:hypothetical protein
MFNLIIKSTTCINFSNLFWNRTLHVSDRFSVHHQESSTVYTAIGVCHTVLDSWWWTEILSETCRVPFQNKCEKLVHLSGLIVRIYHDAQSSECQNEWSCLVCRLMWQWHLLLVIWIFMVQISAWSLTVLAVVFMVYLYTSRQMPE